jgi:hypothetical protein
MASEVRIVGAPLVRELSFNRDLQTYLCRRITTGTSPPRRV